MKENEERKKYIKNIEDSKRKGNYKKTQLNLEKLLKLDPNNKDVKFQLAFYNLANGNIIESENIVNGLLKSYPEDIQLLKFNASQNFNLKNYKRTIEIYKKILDIDKEDIESFINIAKVFNELKNYDEIIRYSKKGLKLDENNILLIHNLAAGLIYKKKFTEAFECTKKIDLIDGLSTISVSMGNFLKEQLNTDYHFNFINSPINYIHEFNIDPDIIKNSNIFKKPNEYLKKFQPDWEPDGKATRNGFQTKSNLFSDHKNDEEIKKLINLIKTSVKNYLIYFKSSNDYYIKKFPQSVTLKGWAVILNNQGYQRSHNHPDGWLSGVIYIKIPENLSKDEGKIEFSSKGYNFPTINNNITKKLVTPKEGKLLLFPSSLYHRTIPFKIDDDRISVAFDIIQNDK